MEGDYSLWSSYVAVSAPLKQEEKCVISKGGTAVNILGGGD